MSRKKVVLEPCGGVLEPVYSGVLNTTGVKARASSNLVAPTYNPFHVEIKAIYGPYPWDDGRKN